MDAERQTFRLIACPTLSHEHRQDRYEPIGRTLGDSLRGLGWETNGLHARVFIDGELIPDAAWETVTPRDGQAVVVRRIPLGPGGGGDRGKQAMQIVGMLALVVASVVTAGAGIPALGIAAGSLSANLVGAAILIGGTLALRALVPPPRPILSALSGQRSAQSPTLSLTGSSNQMAPYARIPRVYGRHRIYPPLAAKPYTDVQGNQQYLNLLFCFGYGPLFVRDIKIGDTPISAFPDKEMELLIGIDGEPPLSANLAPKDVEETNLSVKLTNTYVQQTSADNAHGLSIDVTFPSGLIQTASNGAALARTVAIDIQYKLTTSPTWISFSSTVAAAAQVTTLFEGSDNNLTFTWRASGVVGNSHVIVFNHLPQGSPFITVTSTDLDGHASSKKWFYIYIKKGVTTAAQVKAMLDALPVGPASSIASYLTVVLAPGTATGNGVIPLPQQAGPGPPYYQVFRFAGGVENASSQSITATSQTLVRKTFQVPVPTPGERYDIRIKRVTAEVNQGLIRDEVYWTVLRTVQPGPSVTKPGLCLLALRIRATDQLNGVIDNLSGVASSILMDWDASAGEWRLAETSNPASIYRDVLQGSANSRPKDDDELDFAAIQDFHERCAVEGFTFNAVIDFQTTVKQLRQDVLAAGRGTFGMRDMKYSVVQDLVQATPVDIITPRTTSGFKWTRRFLEVPHALRVRFVDESSDYKQSESLVYSAGYSAVNATLFEDADGGLGVTNWAQVWKMKKRELAEAQRRADDYEVRIDFAHLNATRGDRVQLQHDVILAGLLTARIKSVTLNGSNEATDITFDDVLVMDGSTSYGARIRLADGEQLVQQVVTVAGEQTGVEFSTPIAAGSVPAVGDVVIFGILGRESLDCIVKTIVPGPDLTATLLLLDYAPEIQTADTVEALPVYTGNLTFPTDRPRLTIPAIIQAVSDESVLIRDSDGSLQNRIVVSLHFASGYRVPPTRIEAQHRPTGSDDEWRQTFTAVVGTSVEVGVSPVQEGVAYDVRLRAIDDRTGQASDWATIDSHLVIGKTSLPPDVSILTLEGTRLRWGYPSPPADLDGFLIRFRRGRSTLWANAIPAHEHVIRTTDFQIFAGVGEHTFLVKAVDVGGNESANAQSITVNLGLVSFENVVVTIDHRTMGWPGTITNGSVVDGDLIADSDDPFWPDSDATPMWDGMDADLFWDDAFGEMVYEFSVIPTADVLDALLKIDIEMQGDWRMEYRTDSTVSMWGVDADSPMWDDDEALMWGDPSAYIQWPGALDHLKQQAYFFRVIGAAGAVQAVIEELQVLFDVPDLSETFEDVVIADIGTRLPLTKTYRAITKVRPVLQDDAGDGAYVKVMDKNATLGPLLQVFDTDGVATAGLVDVVVHGY